MTSLLSSLSGQFTKSFLFGTFLPVVIFVVLGLAIGLPLLPPEWPLLEEFKALDKEWLTIVATLLSVLIAGLLNNLNIPIIRLFEGYPWRRSLFGRLLCWQKTRTRNRLLEVRTRLKTIRTWWREEFKETTSERYNKINGSLKVVGRLIDASYLDASDVLPTRLGNTILSSERYSLKEYGLEAISVWPRIVAVIPKDFAAGIDDAKSAMDFLLNTCVLSGVFGILLLAAGLYSGRPFSNGQSFAWWLAELVVLCLAALLCYRSSISSASAWGQMIRSTFDLYRFDLLKQMGIKQMPSSRSAERTLWTTISQQETYGDIGLDVPQGYAEPRFVLKTDPPGLDVRTSAGVQIGSAAPTGKLLLFCQIENWDKTPAKKVTVSLSPPAGFEFEWGSAMVTSGGAKIPIQPSGSQFEVGPIAPSNSLIFECGAIPVQVP